jgi:hypothetical protein
MTEELEATPRETNGRARWVVGACLGAGVGAGLMYLFDPQRGNSRRAKLRDQSAHWARRQMEQAAGAVHHYRNELAGVAAEARHLVECDDASDDVLVARARTRLGRLVRHPHDIEVLAENGEITLRGKAATHEMEHLVAELSAVRGVHQVHNQLLKAPAETSMFAPVGQVLAGLGTVLGIVKLLRRG